MAVLFLELRRDLAEFAHRDGGVAHFRGELAGLQPRIEIFRVERAEANRDFRRALAIAARLAPLGDLQEKLLRVRQRALLGGEIARLEHRVLVVRLDLEDFLVERRGLWIEPLVGEVIGNAGVLLDALFDLLGAHVEIAQRVGAVPVARLRLDDLDVFDDRGVDLAKFQGLFRCL